MLLFWQKQIHVDFTGKYFEERDPDLWRWQNRCLDWRKLGLDADLNNTTLWRRLTTGSGSDAMMTVIFFFPFFSIFAVFPPRTPDLGRTRELRRSSADLLCSWRVLPTPADVDFFLHRHRMRRFVEFRFESTVHSRFRSSSSEFAAQVGAVQICCSSRRSVLKILTIRAVTGFYFWSYMLFLSKK